ncbi:hypothetical protein Golax_023015, partial [Gossypium laxum]|nr:hypothetical protein [Gossypium laxum]
DFDPNGRSPEGDGVLTGGCDKNSVLKGHSLGVKSISKAPLFESVNLIVELSCAQLNLEVGKYNKEYKPDIVGLLEGGDKVDKIIAKLGFHYSHWVKAIRFFGGIWVGWKDRFKLSYCVTIFNLSLYESLKKGGCLEGRRCSLFGNFLEKAGLQDLGFLAGWVEHPSFSNFVRDDWNFNGKMVESLSRFTTSIKEWNKSMYEHLVAEAVKFFQILYGECLGQMPKLLVNSCLRLDQNDILFLGKEVSREEINATLFDMAPLKSSGSDGFHALFFQNQWDLVGDAICDWIQKVFAGNVIDPELNNLLVVLIPKVSNPERYAQFRSISLCSVLYKLVIKVIANRYKTVFLKIITSEQAGFITGKK